jgi:hypothetical protein
MSDHPTPALPPAETAPAVDPAEERRARALASSGATVTLDPESDAALGARGGLAEDMMGNIVGRDAALPPEVHAGTHGGVVRGAGKDAALHRHHADPLPAPQPPADEPVPAPAATPAREA